MKSIQELAQEAKGYFMTKERDNGEKYICAPDAPEWVKNIIFTAHDGMMPEDYKYQFIEEAFCIIADTSEENLDSPEIEADCYTGELTAWLHSDCRRVYYLTEALENYGTTDGFQALTQAQYLEREEIYYSVLEGLREVYEEQED